MYKIFKRIFPILLCFLFFCGVISVARADEAIPNNAVGVDFNQPEEDVIKKAAQELINTNGGDWGYGLVTIQHGDRDIQRWNKTFNLFRRYHLNPIVRLATEACGESWCIPTIEDAKAWADFLGNLKWPTKKRYVIIYNEPNHAKEWGGTLDPEGYATIAKAHIDALVEKSPDFIPLLAGFDSAAPNGSSTIDEANYLKAMLDKVPDLFNKVDCIASHSYANPGFSGRPTDRGRSSIINYQWELGLLQKLGVNKDLCVLITETGWPHFEGTSVAGGYYQSDTLAKYYPIYFDKILHDTRVVATTLFMVKDCGQFEHFSLIDCASGQFYPYVDAIKAVPKTKGVPEQQQLYNVSAMLPREMTVDSTYNVFITLKNGGQAWVDIDDGYRFGMLEGDIKGAFTTITDMQPGTSKTINFTIRTGSEVGDQCAKVGLFKDDRPIVELFKWCYTLSPQPSFDFTVTSGDAEIQFFDQDEQLVFKQKVNVANTNHGHINTIKNVIIGDTYRVVVVKNYYLPIQNFLKIQNGANTLDFGHMLPIDFNNDGKFSLIDLLSIKNRFTKD